MDERFGKIVAANILENAPFAEKLPAGVLPEPVGFTIDRTGSGEILYKNQEALFEEMLTLYAAVSFILIGQLYIGFMIIRL